MWDTIKYTNLCIMRVPKERRKTANNFLNLMRNESPHPAN